MSIKFEVDLPSKIIADFSEYQLGSKNSYELFKLLYKFSLSGMNFMNESSNNGEEFVLHFLHDKIFSSNNKPILFDVGANVGKYTRMLRNIFPSAEIHSFEPSVKTFSELQKNISDCNATLNNFGLSDSHQQMSLHYDNECSGLASLYNRDLKYRNIDFSKSETITVDTLDYYCVNNHIDHIDFLKMDVEGSEIDVLHGSTHMLEENKILSMQFEFGGCNIDSRTFFKDFWNILNDSFVFYRIFYDGFVEIKNYDESCEIFAYQNIFLLNKCLE